MLKRKHIPNIIIITVSWIVYELLMSIVYPLAIGDVSVHQFENSDAQYAKFQLTSFIWHNLWAVPTLITVFLIIPIVIEAYKNYKK